MIILDNNLQKIKGGVIIFSNFFKQMSLQKKLGVLMIILSLIFIVNFFIMYRLVLQQEQDSKVINVAGRQRMLTQKMTKEALMLLSDKVEIDSQKMLSTMQEFDNSLRDLINGNQKRNLPPTQNEKILTQMNKVEELWQPFKKQIKVISSKEAKLAQKKRALAKVKATNIPLLKEMNKAVGMYESNSAGNQILLIQVIILLVGLILVSVIWLVISKTVVNPVVKMTDLIEKVSAGDLTVSIQDQKLEKREDEIGQIASALKKMLKALNDLVSGIDSAADEVSIASTELASSSQQTASSVEEVAGSAQEFSRTTEEVSENAEDMAQVAKQVNQVADKGAEQMNSTQQKMENIVASSKDSIQMIEELNEATGQVKDIVEVISDIAEQTNLLALNAAIEAARAGEHGQGFAVVADEIRELAGQTQDSVDNIKEIIGNLTSTTEEVVSIIDRNNVRVEEGGEALQEAGSSFDEIVENIEGLTSRVQGIADSTQQLLAGSEEISSATEDQASAMQEIAGASEELNAMAERLEELVAQFQVK